VCVCVGGGRGPLQFHVGLINEAHISSVWSACWY